MSKLDELIQELCPDGVECRELQEILKIRNGGDYKSFGEGNIPVYGSGGIMTYVDRYAYDQPSVLIPRKGSIDKLYYVDTPFWNVDTIFYTEIDTQIALPRYIYHCLLREHLEKYNTAGGVPSLTQKVLNKVKIPVPPLPVQREIVRILDSYTERVEQLTAELAAELAARKKQYEYYRDQLLNFRVHGGGDN
jgi:type I restriction enzyme S subunit